MWQMPFLSLDCRRRILRRKDRASSQPDHKDGPYPDLVRNFSQSGFEGSRQVFIVQDADKMHVNAANSLLKVMEEPQSEIYLFLLTSDENLILPTIKSRAQQVHFPKKQAYLARKRRLDQITSRFSSSYSQTEEEAKRLAASPRFLNWQKIVISSSNVAQSKRAAYLEVATW